MNNFESRFFILSDEKKDVFFFNLHPSWWSRFYEYSWASKFANSEDVALDAASGIAHPFKFFLHDTCREVYAIDNDPRILSEESIRRDVRMIFGDKELMKLDEQYFTNIHYTRARLENMPYPDKMFDKIYCISVLEHLRDWFNTNNSLTKIPLLKRVVPRNLYYALVEFKRVLKDDGMIILTFDYPTINLEYFKNVVSDLGLHYVDGAQFSLPANALHSEERQLYCFRAVLKK